MENRTAGVITSGPSVDALQSTLRTRSSDGDSAIATERFEDTLDGWIDLYPPESIHFFPLPPPVLPVLALCFGGLPLVSVFDVAFLVSSVFPTSSSQSRQILLLASKQTISYPCCIA